MNMACATFDHTSQLRNKCELNSDYVRTVRITGVIILNTKVISSIDIVRTCSQCHNEHVRQRKIQPCAKRGRITLVTSGTEPVCIVPGGAKNVPNYT